MRTRFSLPASMLTAGTLAAFAIPAHAAVISISATSLSSNGAEIGGGSITTQYVAGFNVNDIGEADTFDDIDDGKETPNPVVNGVTFFNVNPGQFSISVDEVAGNDGNASNQANYTDVSLQDLMGSFRVSPDADPGDPGVISVTVNDLIVGQRYRVQMLHEQQLNNPSARTMEVLFGDTSSTDTTGTFIASSPAQISTIDFTADASTQLFTLVTPDANSGRSVLNGIALYTVPEPASLALLTLGGLLCAGRRRR